MREIGIIREVDSFGRIGLPRELRNTMSINKNEEMEIYVDKGTIILKKCHNSCIFCGNTEDVFKYRNKSICKECIDDIGKR